MAGSIGGRKPTPPPPRRRGGLLADEGKEGRKRAVKEGLATTRRRWHDFQMGREEKREKAEGGRVLRSTKCNCAKGRTNDEVSANVALFILSSYAAQMLPIMASFPIVLPTERGIIKSA